ARPPGSCAHARAHVRSADRAGPVPGRPALPRAVPACAPVRVRGRGERRVVSDRRGLTSAPVGELLGYRERFPILAETTYLINHSLGAMPAAAEERLLAYAEAWRTRGVRAWEEGWWELPWTVGDQIGRLIGASSGSTVMHQN